MPTVSEGFECFDCAEGRHDQCTGEAYVEWESGECSEVECKCADLHHQPRAAGVVGQGGENRG